MSTDSLNNSAAAAAKAVPPVVQLFKNELAALEWPREGGMIEAKFLRKTSRMAFFDLGRFGTGIVFGVEFLNARDIIRNLEPGAAVSAKVVTLDGEDGYTELSLTEAGRFRLWREVQDYLDSGEIVKVKVVAMNPSGYLVSLGDLRAFLPFSQLSAEHTPQAGQDQEEQRQEELRKLVGTELSVKVINVNPKKNKLIVSERDSVSVNVKELLGQYQVGQVVDGIVSGIADFGIFVKFVDNPQIEGLVHISEIDYRIIDAPKEVVQMNEAVKVKIIDIKDGRVYLSLKALRPDPWPKVSELYKNGDEVRGTVYKFNPFGAVINLDENYQGVIHVSEFGGSDEMKNALQVGQPYSFVIDSVKTDERRIVLKRKQ